MRAPISSLINTRLQTGAGTQRNTSRFRFLVSFLALSLVGATFAAQSQDAEYEAVAEEYVKTFLTTHPLQGTALGLHEYDGKISDDSQLALKSELFQPARL